MITLRFHVPKSYILWPECSPYFGTLGPKYILFGYMDPQALVNISLLKDVGQHGLQGFGLSAYTVLGLVVEVSMQSSKN